MPHISLPLDLPGLLGPLAVSKDTAKSLMAIAHQLLHIETPTLPRADRQLIASYVSYLNDCVYCSETHGAIADLHAGKPGWARSVWRDCSFKGIESKLHALLLIAGKVQGAPREVSNEDIQKARATGATDMDIHDAVLIASACCMYNRYILGLATNQPARGDEYYKNAALKYAADGYVF